MPDWAVPSTCQVVDVILPVVRLAVEVRIVISPKHRSAALNPAIGSGCTITCFSIESLHPLSLSILSFIGILPATVVGMDGF